MQKRDHQKYQNEDYGELKSSVRRKPFINQKKVEG